MKEKATFYVHLHIFFDKCWYKIWKINMECSFAFDNIGTITTVDFHIDWTENLLDIEIEAQSCHLLQYPKNQEQ